jgi:hypothetical protein
MQNIKEEATMRELLTAIIALCATAMFVLPVMIYRASMCNQRQMEKITVATATLILISGRTVGELNTDVRLLNE